MRSLDTDVGVTCKIHAVHVLEDPRNTPRRATTALDSNEENAKLEKLTSSVRVGIECT